MCIQGHGRRPASEVVSLAKEELDAMATLLGEQSFFLGTSHPTTVDCTLYAFLASVVRTHHITLHTRDMRIMYIET